MTPRRFRLRRRDQLLFTSRSAPGGYLEFAGWLGQGVLWIDGWLTLATGEPREVTVVLDGVEVRLSAPCFRFPRFDLGELPGAEGQISILPLAGLTAGPRRLDALYVRGEEDGWYCWSPRRGLPIQRDLVLRLAEKVSYFEPGVRTALGEFWTRLPAILPALDADPLFERNDALARRLLAPEEPGAEDEEAGALDGDEDRAEAVDGEGDSPAAPEPEAEVEEADAELEAGAAPEEEAESEAEAGFEEEGGAEPEAHPEPEEEAEPAIELMPLNAYQAGPALPAGVSVDRVLKIAPQQILLKGWIWDAEDVAEGFTLALPSGRRMELLDTVARVSRSDVADVYRETFSGRADRPHGFFGMVETGEPVTELRRFLFELRLRDREPLQVLTLAWTDDPFVARDELFLSLPEPDLDLVPEHVHPAVHGLQIQCRERVRLRRSFAFGESRAVPGISLVIALGERVELMEHQLAQLADDPDLGDAELIYVLDRPHLEARFERAAFQLSRLYRRPIRGLVLSAAAGYAAATNVGVDSARGRLLVLMHSDVLAAGRWLRPLAELHASRRQPGPVGPKLLYEDGSLQHAGVELTRDLEPDGLWTPRHLSKGLPGRHPAANEARAVPAVSGACLMIGRELFERVGGLRDDYAAGDFEDVDLCLRCLEEGCESWYLPAAELYHLEGQSRQPGPGWGGRNPWTRLYNRWLLTHLWDERLGEPSDLRGAGRIIA